MVMHNSRYKLLGNKFFYFNADGQQLKRIDKMLNKIHNENLIAHIWNKI